MIIKITKIVIRKLISKLQKLVAITPGGSGYLVKWTQAESYLCETVSVAATEICGYQEQREINWIRLTSFQKSGIFEVNSAFIISIPYSSTEINTHRKIYTASKVLQPIISTQKNDTFHAMGSLLRKRKINRIKLHGKTALLGAYFADSKNYFHFWADTIGDIWFLEKMGIDINLLDHILLLYADSKWQNEILAMCNIPAVKLVSLSDYDLIECEQLILPIRTKGGQVNPVWLVKALHETSKWCDQQAEKSTRKIYISRLDADRRKLINENDVIDLVSSLGFEIIECSKLTVEEQRKLFASASIVIAPHGAALTNIVWMHQRSTLIELLPQQHAYPCFYDMARIIGLNYTAIECTQLDKNDNPLFADIHVSLDAVKNTLSNMVN